MGEGAVGISGAIMQSPAGVRRTRRYSSGLPLGGSGLRQCWPVPDHREHGADIAPEILVPKGLINMPGPWRSPNPKPPPTLSPNESGHGSMSNWLGPRWDSLPARCPVASMFITVITSDNWFRGKGAGAGVWRGARGPLDPRQSRAKAKRPCEAQTGNRCGLTGGGEGDDRRTAYGMNSATGAGRHTGGTGALRHTAVNRPVPALLGRRGKPAERQLCLKRSVWGSPLREPRHAKGAMTPHPGGNALPQ
ncbi:hypothetical protein AAFF_G00039880 [Aldrovandia affinis]|uniref:Uncharacterized protein n=1 Tax=Aldrovandia affinis TaxID=143900 RepID=A0AAD7WFF2_9TELE|nr:hypothetical protein AAFF_G00039880 [Aldrovandia affinis]